MSDNPPSLWQNSQFRIYIGSTAFTGTALAMQQLLITWLLVGILLLPATQVGTVQALIGLPGILLMLWGGAVADRVDPRSLLIRVYGLAWIFPIVLFSAVQLSMLNIWTVCLFGLVMSTAISFSNPSQQAILNRIAGDDVQRGVTAATTMSFIVQIFGLSISGQMETIGVDVVLLMQSLSLILGAVAAYLLAPAANPPAPTKQRTIHVVLEGLKATVANRTILHTLIVTFISGIFNYGAFAVAVPFIVKRAYDGDALGFATMMIIFYAGATVSNAIQYWIMPLSRPGYWFLLMQATRAIVLFLIWLQPGWWVLGLLMFTWGLNMGVTTNLGRAIVQESSDPAYLARLLSVFSLGNLGAIPIGAVLLGLIIEIFGEINALIPAMFISILLCLYGFVFTDIGRYRSPHAIPGEPS